MDLEIPYHVINDDRKDRKKKETRNEKCIHLVYRWLLNHVGSGAGINAASPMTNISITLDKAETLFQTEVPAANVCARMNVDR